MKRCSHKVFACTAILILFTLFRCENSYRKEQSSVGNKFTGFLSEVGMTEPPSKLIIVPTHGCGPCIKSAMDFLRDSEKSSNFAVIVSGPSRKSCLLLMKKFNLIRTDALIDARFQSKDYGIVTIYPTILSYDNGKWNSTDITPENYNEVFEGVQ
jgi:hypothetical protein